jgi:hypothetical protein
MSKDGSKKDGSTYEFAVAATMSLAVVARDGRKARDAVAAALNGVTARLTSGAGIGIELNDVRVLEHAVVLRTIDGSDPTATLRTLLDAWKGRNEQS